MQERVSGDVTEVVFDADDQDAREVAEMEAFEKGIHTPQDQRGSPLLLLLWAVVVGMFGVGAALFDTAIAVVRAHPAVLMGVGLAISAITVTAAALFWKHRRVRPPLSDRFTIRFLRDHFTVGSRARKARKFSYGNVIAFEGGRRISVVMDGGKTEKLWFTVRGSNHADEVARLNELLRHAKTSRVGYRGEPLVIAADPIEEEDAPVSEDAREERRQ